LAALLASAVGETRSESDRQCVHALEASPTRVRCAQLREVPGFLRDTRFDAVESVASYRPDGRLREVSIELKLGATDTSIYPRLIARLGAANAFGVNYLHPENPDAITNHRHRCHPGNANSATLTEPNCRIATVVLDWRLPERTIRFRRWGDLEALVIDFESPPAQ